MYNCHIKDDFVHVQSPAIVNIASSLFDDNGFIKFQGKL